MASFNRVQLIGNLGRDPELRYTSTNTPVVTLNLATTEVHNDKDGQKQEVTEWHRVVVWGKQAEICAKYLAKGRSVFVEGRLQTREWQDKDGQKRFTTEIIAQRVQFLGGGAHETEHHEQPVEHKMVSGESFPPPRPRRINSLSKDFGQHEEPFLDEIPF